jgi:hypothetical protein
MLRPLFAIAVCVVPFLAVPVRAEDSTVADLNKAKAAHAKELARLRDRLLTDIDAVIRKDADAGEGLNYLLKEKKGCDENGVLPVLPKLLPASRAYADGKREAAAELEKAYTAAIAASARSGELEQVAKLRDELKALRGAGQSPEALVQANPKDDTIEKNVARAKSEYGTAMKAASADLVVVIEDSRTKVAASRTLSNDEKLKQLELLANEKRAFEASVALPKSPALRTGRQQFDEAARKAQQAFAKAMDAAAAAYLERKDVATFQAVSAEKKRLLAYPNSIDLLAMVDPLKDAIAGGWDLKKGVLSLVNPVEVSIIQIPYEPGPEYNLHLTVERLEGSGYLAVGVLASGRQCTVMFDGHAGPRTGIQLIDGKYLPDNGTALTGRQLPPNKLMQLDLSVRKDSINAWVKGPDEGEHRQIVNYTGPQDRVSIETDYVKGIKNTKALLLHQHTSKFAISAIALDPIGRDGGKASR